MAGYQGSLASEMSSQSLHEDWSNQGCVACPVVRTWLTLDAVVTRGASGKICDVQSLPLKRETVADNSEVLYPVIEHFGPSAGFNIVFDHSAIPIWVQLNWGLSDTTNSPWGILHPIFIKFWGQHMYAISISEI